MFSIEQAKLPTERLLSFMKSHRDDLSIKIYTVESNLASYALIREFKEKEDIKIIESLFSGFSPLILDLINHFRVIEYLRRNNITNVSQYRSALEGILNSNIVRNCERKIEELTKIRTHLHKEKLKYDRFLSGSGHSSEEFLKSLEESTLSEEDKLAILSLEAFKTCPDMKKTVRNDSEEVIKNYQAITSRVNDFLKKYYHLIESGNSRQTYYRKTAMNIMNESESEVGVLDNKQNLILHLLSILDIKKTLEEEMEKSMKSKDFDLVLLGIDELGDKLNSAEILADDFSLQQQEEKNEKPSRVLYLLDGKELYFDYSTLANNDERKEALKGLLEKFDKSSDIGDIKVKKLRHDGGPIKHNAYIARASNFFLSFVRLSEDLVLALTISDNDSIFDLTKEILKSRAQDIEEIKKLAVQNKEKLIASQQEEITKLHKALEVNSEVLR